MPPAAAFLNLIPSTYNSHHPRPRAMLKTDGWSHTLNRGEKVTSKFMLAHTEAPMNMKAEMHSCQENTSSGSVYMCMCACA